MCDVNDQRNATPKMDKFSWKCIMLGEVVKVGGKCLLDISNGRDH